MQRVLLKRRIDDTNGNTIDTLLLACMNSDALVWLLYVCTAADRSELACTYAALILHDDGIAVTADKIASILAAAKVEVEPYWPSLFERALKGRNVDDLLLSVSGTSTADRVGFRKTDFCSGQLLATTAFLRDLPGVT